MEDLPFVREIIESALDIAAKHATKYKQIGPAWLSALREAFEKKYGPDLGPAHQPQLAVFGGKPPTDAQATRCPHGIPKWDRWEFMHDVSVVEVEWIKAPYRSGTDVPVVKRVVWQVESEVSTDSTEVAEDLSKLIAGSADYKLLIVAHTKQLDKEPWYEFPERAAKGISGTAFVAWIPTYAGKKTISDWLSGVDMSEVEVRPLGRS